MLRYFSIQLINYRFSKIVQRLVGTKHRIRSFCESQSVMSHKKLFKKEGVCYNRIVFRRACSKRDKEIEKRNAMLKPKPSIDTIQPYQGGKPIEEVRRELGIADIIKLASNENPLGPSPLAMQAISESAPQVHLYPDGNAYYLKADLAEHIGISAEHLILGNGSNDVLQLVAEAYVAPR